jgi:hypothetical protein
LLKAGNRKWSSFLFQSTLLDLMEFLGLRSCFHCTIVIRVFHRPWCPGMSPS